MRRTVLTLLVAGLVAGGAPASADTVCENPLGADVIAIGGGSSTITTPSGLIGNESEEKEFILDLSPAGDETTADLTVTMTWDVPLNDYDLAVESSLGSAATEDYQPFDPPVETATIRAAHCDTIYVTAIDYLAPVVIDSLSLSFNVSNIAHE